jgi:hypothetical protein
MIKFKFHWIGWFREGTSDKVWGYCSQPSSETCYIFWGRRGKALSFKRDTEYYARGVKYKKANKGYSEINEKQLTDIWPTFGNDLSKRLTLCILKDSVM